MNVILAALKRPDGSSAIIGMAFGMVASFVAIAVSLIVEVLK